LKVLVVHFEDGKSFTVPAEFVAKNRADYYVSVDPEASRIGEIEYALADEFELLDWARNNLNWVDVEDAAKPYWESDNQLEETYDAQWPNAEMEVQEI